MAVFVGEFDQTLDPAKHRLAIPSALRDVMDPEVDGTSFYLVLGPGRHLWLYPDKYYQSLLSPLQQNPFPNRSAQKVSLLFALARVVKPDAQGRVVLPEKSMKRAELAEDLTLVGQGDHIEIWPTGKWEKHVDEALPRYDDDMQEAGDDLNPAPASDK